MEKHIYKEPLILGICGVLLIVVCTGYFLFRDTDTKKTVDNQTPTVLQTNLNQAKTNNK